IQRQRHPGASRPASSRMATSRPASTQPAQLIAIKDITRDILHRRVIVEGVVTQLVTKPSKTRERIHIYTVTQDDHTIDFIYWEDLAKKLSAAETPSKGQRVRIRGRVDEYNGNLQLRPGGPLDVEILK